jgi:hypothetical protein
VASIKMMAAARRAGLTAERARIFGDSAAILMSEGANQVQRSALARSDLQVANSMREATYARDAARFTQNVGKSQQRTAWVAAAGSLFGSAMTARGMS